MGTKEKISINWKNKAPGKTLKWVFDSASLNKSGDVVYNAQDILASCLDVNDNHVNANNSSKLTSFYTSVNIIINTMNFDSDVDFFYRHQIVKKAIQLCIQNKTFEASNFLDNVNVEYKNIINTESIKFCVTSLSIINDNIPEKLEVFDSIIYFDRTLPEKYLSRTSIDNFKNCSDYVKCIVETKTKSEESNVHLRNLNIFRAVLCLFINYDMQIKCNNENEPINRIRLGKIHTIHNEDGSVLKEKYSYEPKFIYTRPLSVNTDVLNTVIEIISKIESCKYKKTFVGSLLSYVEAFDDIDENVSIMLLWNAIDIFLNESKGNYKAIPKRIKALYGDNSNEFEIIEIIREARNNYVHRCSTHDQARDLCFMLQRIYKDIFFFFLENLSDLNSKDEALATLDYISKFKDDAQKRSFKKALEIKGRDFLEVK